MLGEVIAFGLIISAFEFVLLSMLAPRTRLRVLGSSGKRMCFHVGMLIINLTVHWGTVVGTMSATLSFITSMGVLWFATVLFGSIKDDRYYTVGLIKYSTGELK